MIYYESLFSFIPYFVIALVIGLRFFIKNKEKILWIGIVISVITCCFFCTINFVGALFLLILFGMIFLYKRMDKSIFLFLSITLFSLTIYLHFLPGFNNIPIYNNVQISKDGWPFTMYLNFNKAIAALIISMLPGIFIKEGSIFPKKVFKTIGIGIITVLICALILNFIRFDAKISSILPLWAFNNLVFVCFAEEVLFRGFIQRNLMAYTKSPVTAIIISAILFGGYHYTGGLTYILLSTIAGIFYGYAYHQTKRIETSILFHFILNTIHILFFTYPALKY